MECCRKLININSMKDFFQKIANVEVRNILAVVTVICTFLLLYLLIVKPVPGENKDILYAAVGFVFGGALSAVMGFYYGSMKTDKKEEEKPWLIIMICLEYVCCPLRIA